MCMRGDIYWVDLTEYAKKGTSLQSGMRPVIIIQNNMGNRFSPTVIVSPITTKLNKANMPTHVLLDEQDGLGKPSLILLEQLITIDKNDLKDKICSLNNDKMKKIDIALVVSGGIDKNNLIDNEIDIQHLNDMIKLINDSVRRIEISNSKEYFISMYNTLVKELKYYCKSCGINYETKIEKHIKLYEVKEQGVLINAQ